MTDEVVEKPHAISISRKESGSEAILTAACDCGWGCTTCNWSKVDARVRIATIRRLHEEDVGQVAVVLRLDSFLKNLVEAPA